jgi:uncharacterized protein YkwD
MAWALALVAAAPAAAAPGPCNPDEALSRAAATLVLEGGAPNSAELVRAVRRAGSGLPVVHALPLDPTDGAARLERWLERIRSRGQGQLVCGQARSADRRLVLAGLRGGQLLDAESPAGGARPADEAEPIRLRVELTSGFGDPHLVARAADGEMRRLAIEAEDGRRNVRVPASLARPVRVQLVAKGPTGPRPVAERVVGRTEGGTRDPMDVEIAGTEAFAPRKQLRRLRSLHDASRVRPNRLLSEEASAHAERVCEQQRVGHRLGRGADPERRLERRGLRARVVGEVVARAQTPSAALEGLFDSPSHLMTMVDERFTDAGWGRATDERGRTCLVLLLAAWPRFVGR